MVDRRLSLLTAMDWTERKYIIILKPNNEVYTLAAKQIISNLKDLFFQEKGETTWQKKLLPSIARDFSSSKI